MRKEFGGHDEKPACVMAPSSRSCRIPTRSPGAAAEFVAAQARAAVAAHGRFTFAVSGGRTPWAMFAHLADEDVPWDRTAIFQVDERVAPGRRPRPQPHPSAGRRCRRSGDAEVHPMPVEDDDLDAAAARYAAVAAASASTSSTSASGPTATRPRSSRATRCST